MNKPHLLYFHYSMIMGRFKFVNIRILKFAIITQNGVVNKWFISIWFSLDLECKFSISFSFLQFLALRPSWLSIEADSHQNMMAHNSLVYCKCIMQDYCYHNFGWDNISSYKIDWDPSERDYQCLSQGCHPVSFKLQNSLWPPSKILYWCNLSAFPHCSSWNLCPETHINVFCCKKAKPIWHHQWILVLSILKTNQSTLSSIHDIHKSLSLVLAGGKTGHAMVIITIL